MAWAKVYDEWFDSGVAYSTDEVAAWEREAFCLNYRDHGVEQLAVLARHVQLPEMSKPKTAGKALRWWMGGLQFFCIKAQVAAWDGDRLVPDPKTPEGKELTSVALNLDVRGWVEGNISFIESQLRDYVTHVRSAGHAPKAKRTFDNQVVNAMVSQRDGMVKCLTMLDSMVK